MLKKLSIGLMSAALLLGSVSIVSAHVTVKPDKVGVAAFQTFAVSVPNEKEIATVAIRLVIPEGANHVTPTVKPGWEITTKTTGEGEEMKVTEITWSGGSIPSERRDDFSFSAQVPSDEDEINWKAYQTYEDGTVVSWDQDPSAEEHEDEESDKGPYSVTKVVNDLESSGDSTTTNLPLLASGFAVLVSLIAISLALKKKKSA